MSLDLISREDVIKIIKNAASSCEGTAVSNVFDLVEERINTLARPVCSYIKITNIPDVRENWYRCSICGNVSLKHNYPTCPVCSRKIVCFCEE